MCVRSSRTVFSVASTYENQLPVDIDIDDEDVEVIDADGDDAQKESTAQSADVEEEEVVFQSKEESDGRGWKLVQMTEDHINELLEIQYQCFEPCHCEDREAYVQRMLLNPTGNVVLMVRKAYLPSATTALPKGVDISKMKDRDGFVIAGYIAFQPFFRGEIQKDGDSAAFAAALAAAAGSTSDCVVHNNTCEALGKPAGRKADCMYTHELTISPAFRGKGLTYPLTTWVETQAREAGFDWLTLVALDTAEPFWRKNGYTTNVREIVYGGAKCFYMEKPVPLPPQSSTVTEA